MKKMTYEKEIESFVKVVSKKILESTIKIYCRIGNKIEPYCTGVIVSLFNKPFIITSEHIFQNAGYGDLIVIQKGFPLNIEGKMNGHIEKDIALFEMDKMLAKYLLNDYTLLTLEKIAFGHQVEMKQKYLLVGFPNSKTIIRGTTITETPFVYHTEPTQYHTNNYEIAINYKKRKSLKYNQKTYTFVPDPAGLSGSGLWYIPKFDQQHQGIENFKLVGIFKEFVPKRNVGLVTKIDTIFTFTNYHSPYHGQ